MSSVCLVVPCYNEQRRLDLAAFERFMQSAPDVSFCFVNDGSTDGTASMLKTFASRVPERSTLVVDLPQNGGKAEAVRQGVLRARAWQPFTYIGYWDADLATPLDELHAMRRLADGREDCLMVLGSRVTRLGASVYRRPARHYLGRIFATCASLALRMPVYDTQCGAKLLRASLVPSLFAEPFLSRWYFDVELLARLRNFVGMDAALRGAIELPLSSWHDIEGSRLASGAVLRAPLELWKVFRRYNRDAS